MTALAWLIPLVAYCAIIAPSYAGLNKDEDNQGSDVVIECGTPPDSGNSNNNGSDPGDASTKDRRMYGPCSAKPAPHRSTPLMSPFSSLNTSAYAYLKHKSDDKGSKNNSANNNGTNTADAKERVWQDPAFARGTPGNAIISKWIVGDDQPVNDDKDTSPDYKKAGAKPRMNAARPMINPSQKPQNQQEEACLNRVKWDNAVNQTIMEAARFPFNREDQRLIAWEDESNPSKKLSMKNHCQGLKMTYDPQEEYKAGDYLYAAYQKSLRDPNYRMMNNKSGALSGLLSNVASGAIGQALSGSGEPGISGLSKYKTPYPDKPEIKNIRLNQILSVPYETIVDVTHPFTPRWHYKNNERDEFSPKGKQYSIHEKDNVRAAGDAEKNKVKVDILEFRRKPYAEGINKRISLNQLCFGNQIQACCEITGNTCRPVPCWQCFGLAGKTDTPACSTRHDQDDLTVLPKYVSLVPNRKLPCGTSAASLSEKLRAPYRMVNPLKIRRAQKGHPKDRLPSGSPEGYSHSEYFANRMPYPIQHDTGRPIQDTPSATQLPFDFAGQYAAIVGIGREKRSPSGSSTAMAPTTSNSMLAQLFGVPVALAASGSSEPTNKEKDERCLMGGWGKDTQCAGMKFKKSDPMTSWTELKAYQARTIQDYSINCIGKYEKLYATGNAEGKALMRAGGVYERNICSKRNKDGTSSNCGNNNSSNSGGSGNNKGSSNSNKEFRERRQQEWPLAFRGQMCNKKDFDEDQKKDCQKRQCFPFFGAQKGKCPTLKTGLDDAKPGDMILMFAGGAKEGGSDKPLMPTIAFVKYSHNNANTKDSTPCSESKNCHLIVESADDGQFPDACGNSTSWGVSQSRTLYKPGNMPEIYKKAVKDIQQKNNVKNPSTSCVNAQFGACEYDDWDKAKLYRPTDDVRDDEPS